MGQQRQQKAKVKKETNLSEGLLALLGSRSYAFSARGAGLAKSFLLVMSLSLLSNSCYCPGDCGGMGRSKTPTDRARGCSQDTPEPATTQHTWGNNNLSRANFTRSYEGLQRWLWEVVPIVIPPPSPYNGENRLEPWLIAHRLPTALVTEQVSLSNIHRAQDPCCGVTTKTPF